MQPAHDSPICPGWHGAESITHADSFKRACVEEEAAAVRQHQGRQRCFPKRNQQAVTGAGARMTREDHSCRTTPERPTTPENDCVTAQRPLPASTHISFQPRLNPSFCLFVFVRLPRLFIYQPCSQKTEPL